MNAFTVLLVCSAVGSAVAYYPQRQVPYNTGADYSVDVASSYQSQPSERLFWGNTGTNQVGGTGLWATLTNKFPFLGSMFGRMQLPNEYGAPNQYQTYQAPQVYQSPQTYQAPQVYQPPQTYQAPQVYQPPQTYQAPQNYEAQNYQPQFFQQPSFRRFPTGRDVGFTDDAIIVTPPQVPVVQPAPVPVRPVPPPQPIPVQPPVAQPQPEPAQEGYSYNIPQYRLELPHK